MKLKCLLILPLLVASLQAASVADLTFTLNGDGTEYSVTDCLETASGHLDIPSTYNGLPVTEIDDYDWVSDGGGYAFYNCSNLTSITIPDSVTTIGSASFYNCTSLASITIPDSVTSIGSYAFYNCSSLSSITIPDSVTSIAWYAFQGCSGLTSITIPDSVTSIGEDAFDQTGLSFLEDSNSIKYLVSASGNTAYLIDGSTSSGSIILPNTINGASVAIIGGGAFRDCNDLTSITIPDGVTSIGVGAFYDCSGLTSITIPNSVTSIGAVAFRSCSGLSSITIPDSVTSIGSSAFYDCSGLTSITIPDGVTSIGDTTFSNCTRLSSITIPDSVTSIGAYAFSNCSSLPSITIPDSVTSISGRAFSNCTSLKIIKFDGNAPLQIGNDVFSNIHTNPYIQIKPYATGFSLPTWQGINTGYPRRNYVNANAAAGGDGTSWETAYNDLQDALAMTVSGRGDQVWIAQGTYYPIDINNQAEFDRTATFYIKDEVSLYGGFIGSETDLAQRDWESYPTILSGEIWEDQIYWSIHVATIDNNTVIFDGITITKGNANGSENNTDRAAAVYGGGNVTATNCTFSGNSASSYGGVAFGSAWTATDCTFSGNSASNDGGVAYNAAWTVTNCTFSGNSADHNGGVIAESAWTATDCTFSGNSASNNGGVAVYSALIAANCTFSGNSASNGGVLHYGLWTVTNCTFSGNSASHGGVARDGTWTVTNCTFSGNSAYYGGVARDGTWTVTNCNFSGNSADSNGGVAYSGTWTATNCTFSGNSADSNGGVASSGTWTATNSTFSGNTTQYDGGVAYGGTWKIFNNIFYNNYRTYNNSNNAQFYSSTIHATNETTPSPFIVFANNLISGVSAAFVSCTIPFPIPEANIIDADPLFVNIADPDGPDDIWGTQDDGLRLQSSSPTIGLGDASYLPVDTYDLDGDDDTAESLPLDIAGYKRIQDTTLDLGAYEYGNVIGLSSVFTTTAVAATGGSVSPSGALVNTAPSEITLTATASNGYVFGYWSGDVPEELEQENPLTVTVEEDGSITAVFLQDSSDSDGDGLSQYQEVIVYGTDPGDTDSDDDGFDDGYEVETGYSPMSMSSTPDAISGIETAVKYWFNAASGVNYRIEYSTDFENWYILEDNILGASDKIVRYYDTVGTQKRFYRAKRDD